MMQETEARAAVKAGIHSEEQLEAVNYRNAVSAFLILTGSPLSLSHNFSLSFFPLFCCDLAALLSEQRRSKFICLIYLFFFVLVYS